MDQFLQDKFRVTVRWALKGQQLKAGIPALLSCALGNSGGQVRLPIGPDSSASGTDTLKGITMQPKRIARVKRKCKCRICLWEGSLHEIFSFL